jgi:hypothetical protein
MDKSELPISITVPKSEYIPYCDDLVRIVTIQFVIQFMMLRGASSFDSNLSSWYFTYWQVSVCIG